MLLTLLLVVHLVFAVAPLPSSTHVPFTPAPAFASGVSWYQETGHTLSGPIRAFWEAHGGVVIYGFPLSEPFAWQAETGEQVVAQYFERARLEYHPSLHGTSQQVQAGRLGVELTSTRGEEAAFASVPADALLVWSDCRFVPETSHRLCAPFHAWWDEHGGLETFGYPLSEQLQENGVLVQYFERARLEHQPQFAGTEWEIEVGHLGSADAAERGLLDAPAFAPVSGAPVVAQTISEVIVRDGPHGSEVARLPAQAEVVVLDGPRADRVLVQSGEVLGWIDMAMLPWQTGADPRDATVSALLTWHSDASDLLRDSRAYLSVAIYDPETNALWVDGDAGPVAAASLAKTLIVMTAVQQREARGEGIDDLVGLFDMMITVSDNEATDALWAEVGGRDGVRAFLEANRFDGFEFPSAADWGAASADAGSWATLFATLGSGRLLNPEHTQLLLELFQQVIDQHRWGVLTPADDRLAIGKNGWYADGEPTMQRVNGAAFLAQRDGPPGVMPMVAVVMSHYPVEAGEAWGQQAAEAFAAAALACSTQRWASAYLEPDVPCAPLPTVPSALERAQALWR